MNAAAKRLQLAVKHREAGKMAELTRELLLAVQAEVQQALGKTPNVIPGRLQRSVKQCLAIARDASMADCGMSGVGGVVVELVHCVFDVECDESVRELMWEVFCLVLNDGECGGYGAASDVVGKVFSRSSDGKRLRAVLVALDRLDVGRERIWVRLFSSVILPFFIAYPLEEEFNWEPKTKLLQIGLVDQVVGVFQKLVVFEPAFDFVSLDQKDALLASIAMLSTMGDMGVRSDVLKRFVDTNFRFEVVPRTEMSVPEALRLANSKAVMCDEEKRRNEDVIRFLNSVSGDWGAKLIVEVLRLALIGDDPVKYTLLFRKLAKLSQKTSPNPTVILCMMLSLLTKQCGIPLSLAFLTLLFDSKFLEPYGFMLFVGTRMGFTQFDSVVQRFVSQLVFVFARFYFDISDDKYRDIRDNPVCFVEQHANMCYLTREEISNHKDCRYGYLSAKKWTEEQANDFLFQITGFAETTKEISFIYAVAESLVSLASIIHTAPKDIFIHTCTALVTRLVEFAKGNAKSWSPRLVHAIAKLMVFADTGDCYDAVSELFLEIFRSANVDSETITAVLNAITSHTCLFTMHKAICAELSHNADAWKFPCVMEFLLAPCILAPPAVSDAEDSSPEKVLFSLLTRMDVARVNCSRVALILSMLTLNAITSKNSCSATIQDCWGVFIDSMMNNISYQELSILRVLMHEAAKIHEVNEQLLELIMAKVMSVNRDNFQDEMLIKTRFLIVHDVIVRCKKYSSQLFRMFKELNAQTTNTELREWMQEIAVKIFVSFGTPSQTNLLHTAHIALRNRYCTYRVEIVNEDELILETEQFRQIFSCRIRQPLVAPNPEGTPVVKVPETTAPVVGTLFQKTTAGVSTPDEFDFPQCPEAESRGCAPHERHSRHAINSFVSLAHCLSPDLQVLVPHSTEPACETNPSDWPAFHTVVFGDEGLLPEVEELIAKLWHVRSDRCPDTILDDDLEAVVLVWNGTGREAISHWNFARIRAIVVTPLAGKTRLLRVRCVNPSVSLLAGVYISCLETVCNIIGYYVYSEKKLDYE